MPPKASTSKAIGDGSPLSLPLFLKLLSSPKSKLTMSQSMAAAGKLYPKHASLGALSLLNQENLNDLGLEEEVVKGILNLTAKGKGKGTKRPRGSDMDKPLPTKEAEDVVETDLDFDEILYEEVSRSIRIICCCCFSQNVCCFFIAGFNVKECSC